MLVAVGHDYAAAAASGVGVVASALAVAARGGVGAWTALLANALLGGVFLLIAGAG